MITCLLGSSRKSGNSNIMAEQLLKGTNHKMVHLYEKNIEKVIDNRHSSTRNTHEDDYKDVLIDVLDADTVVLSTPLYWYSMSASLKLFIDRWTESLRDPELPDFKSKMAQKEFIIIIVGGDNLTVKTKPLIAQFKYIFEFMGITNYSFVVGEGVKPLEVLKDEKTIEQIKNLNVELRNRSKQTGEINE
ncbi:flavodoxin family protein [Mammaliicoccus sp. H-M34]|uniref:flavodoxin family protein n=1 Tax=Mammaliicoccus sp. H-M34 TaxID=2898693 RepID=UPI001EFB4F1C|nr:flavodoxin family protein [Mammaliicoccus sp. H-M34]